MNRNDEPEIDCVIPECLDVYKGIREQLFNFFVNLNQKIKEILDVNQFYIIIHRSKQ